VKLKISNGTKIDRMVRAWCPWEPWASVPGRVAELKAIHGVKDRPVGG